MKESKLWVFKQKPGMLATPLENLLENKIFKTYLKSRRVDNPTELDGISSRNEFLLLLQFCNATLILDLIKKTRLFLTYSKILADKTDDMAPKNFNSYPDAIFK